MDFSLFCGTAQKINAGSAQDRLSNGRHAGLFNTPYSPESELTGTSTMQQQFQLEGLTLTVESVDRSLAFYVGQLGLTLEHNATPHFALIRSNGRGGSTIGLLSMAQAEKEGVERSSPAQKRAIHVEFSTDDLDALFAELQANGVIFSSPPHDEPWERSMTALDPDGYAVEFAQGRRGQNALKAE